MGAIGSYFSNFAPISSPGLLVMGKKLYRPTKILTNISIYYRPTLDRYIERLSSDYRPSVDRPSTECWPSIDQLSAKSRPSVGERKAISTETHLEWLSTVSRPSVGRLLTAISTDYRPTIDRVSTAILTDSLVDTTYSKHDPGTLHCSCFCCCLFVFAFRRWLKITLHWIIIIAFLPTTRPGGWEMWGGIRNSRQDRAAAGVLP